MTKLWPGADAKSKALKALVVETLFGTRSWTAVESKSLESLDVALDTLKMFEEKVEDGEAEAVVEPTACLALLKKCQERIASAEQHAQDTVGIL